MRECKEIKIESTTNLGAGAAPLPDGNGKRLFVWGAIDGDTVDVKIKDERASFAEGEILRIVSPSPHRIVPDCGAFTAGCGGCLFRHMTYEHETALKKIFVESAFRREGIEVDAEDVIPSPSETRSKATVSLDGHGNSGYFRRGTHDVVPCERCMIHDAETDEIRAFVTADAKNRGVNIRRMSVRLAECGTSVTFFTDTQGDALCGGLLSLAKAMTERFPDVVCVYAAFKARGRETYRRILGEKYIKDRLGPCEFIVSPPSFYQVNRVAARILYDTAADMAALSDGDMVADLYCGTGTVGIYAARRLYNEKGGRVKLLGIEINPDAVSDAKANAELNGVDAEFRVGRAETSDFSGADIVFLDPPRAGCGRELISHLLAVRPEKIVYISCVPATLARDAKALLDGGYEIRRVAPVDMFPRSGHVECAVLLSRAGE
ncbi:MAG: 23S rRNA (uracil(1939)-C(5))-methyltransferase RlmD [Firmicutes bacterium]|nr:23S rRNA (uracil(1939)-C(5))-methyltransferase RlmD [Bacillota bacterium]